MAKRFLATQNQRYTAAWSAVTAAPLTLACFASADNATANHAFFGISDNEGFTDAFYLTFEGTTAGDPLRAATAASNAFSLSSSTRAFQPGIYHHCAGVFTSATERLVYLDGVAGTVDTTSRTPAGIAHIGVGSEGNNLFKHTGNVFDAAIWNAALTAAEILRLKNGESPMTVRRESLLAYWPCDDRNDSSIVDLVSGRVLAGSGTSLPKNIITPDGYRKRGKTARIYSFAPLLAGGSTGTLAATESGSDTADFTGSLGTVPITGTLSVTESGADTAAYTGLILVQGSFSTSESGLDVAALTGIIPVQGTISVTESDADIAEFIGEGAAIVAEGTLAATESGSDTAAYTGDVIIQGSFSAIEGSTDTLAFTGTITVQGTLAATESGSDTARFTDAPPSLYTNVDLTLLLRI